MLDKYFYYWNIYFYYFFTQNRFWVDHSFIRYELHSLNCIYLYCVVCGYHRKVVLNLQKFRWTNIFTFEMFIFANFLQKVILDQSQFQEVGVALPEFYWFVLCSLRVLKGSYFKAPKVQLDRCFYHWKIHFC